MLLNRHTLVVEDDALVGVSLFDYLEELGAKVSWATNVENALQFVDWADSLHIAIVDLNLDGVMSYPVLDRLLATGVYTILCTGYEAASIDDDGAVARLTQTKMRPLSGLQFALVDDRDWRLDDLPGLLPAPLATRFLSEPQTC
jgi:CheY-like chemotaxis protein